MHNRFFCDFEFNGYGGELISLGIAGPEHCDWLYLVNPDYTHGATAKDVDPWVVDNVLPLLDKAPIPAALVPVSEWGYLISDYLYSERSGVAQIIADWPSDIADLCNLMLVGPGIAVAMPHQTHFTVLRHLDVYPTSLANAIQHNALWDAMALQRWLSEHET